MRALRNVPLVGVLLVSALLELLANRIGIGLFGIGGDASPALRLAAATGLFSYYLTGVLGLILLSWAIIVLIRDTQLLTLWGRICLTLAGALFVPLAVVALVVRLPANVAPHLNTLFGVLLLALIAAFVARPASLRSKLGVIYLAAPLLLHVYSLAAHQLPWLAPDGVRADLPSRVLESGEHLLIVGAFASLLFFAPLSRPSRLLRPVPLMLSAAVLIAATAAVLTGHALASKAAFRALGIHLPLPIGPEAGRLAMYLGALFAFTLTVTALWAEGATSRGIAAGLMLIALGGYRLDAPPYFVLTLVGIVQLVRSALAQSPAQEAPSRSSRSPAASPSPEQLRTYLGRLARASSDDGQVHDAVVLRSDSSQIARVRGMRDAVTFTVRLQLRGGQLQDFELDVGHPPKDDPPACLVRQRARRGRRLPSGRGPRIRGFDAAFTLRDSTDQVGDLLAGLTEPLREHIHGWLGLWPAEGVQYLTRPLADGWPLPLAEIAFSPEDAPLDEPHELVELLVNIARSLEVTA